MVWTLDKLKAETLQTWRSFHAIQECYADSSQFLSEISTHGDLELFDTWKSAWVSLKAKLLVNGCLEDPQFLILVYLLHCSKQEEWRELLPELLQELQSYPEAVNTIQRGIQSLDTEGIYYPGYTTDKEIIDFTVLAGVDYVQHPQKEIGTYNVRQIACP